MQMLRNLVGWIDDRLLLGQKLLAGQGQHGGAEGGREFVRHDVAGEGIQQG